MITTSFVPLDITFPEICAFIIGFSCTVWAKMTSLSYSLATAPQYYKEGKGSSKKYGN